VPTYDYRCNACGHAFELFQSMSAKHEKKCPKCGKSALERLIGTGAAVLFKGSGFYQTDYRSDGYKKAADADKPKAAEPAKAETKAESKPDAKPEAKAEVKVASKSGAKANSPSKARKSSKSK
jgi:putative FmdB family regulatory protein